MISGLKNPAYIDRWVNARWESATIHGGEFEAQIRIIAQPGIRLIADITMALADMRVALLGISTHNRSDCTIVELTVSCKNLDHFKSILSRLRSVENVEEVSRGYTT